MAKFSELRVKFTGDTADLKGAFRQVNAELAESARQAGRSTVGFAALGKSMSDIGQRLTIGLTAPIVGFGAAALKMAGQMEQTTVAFRTMLKSGDAATAMLKDLRQFAATTPFQFTELTDAARKMMALGFAANEVIPTLRTIGDAAGALGLGAEGINRIVLALGQMKAKGTVQAEEMRQLAEAGIPAWDALAKKLGTDVAGAMKLVEQRAVSASVGIAAVTEAMNTNFGGGMAAQAKTLIGLWSNVKDSITFALADIGKVLLPTAKSMVENFIVPGIEGAKNLATAFAALPIPVQNAALAMTAFLAAIGPLSWAVGTTVNGVLALAGAWRVVAVALAAGSTVIANMTAGVVAYMTGLSAATAGTVAFSAAAGGIAAAVAITAVQVWRLVSAWSYLRESIGLQEQAHKNEAESLAVLATKLRQHGVDITDLKKQYTSGLIPQNQYREELLKLAAANAETATSTKVAAEATKTQTAATVAHVKAVGDATGWYKALGVEMRSLDTIKMWVGLDTEIEKSNSALQKYIDLLRLTIKLGPAWQMETPEIPPPDFRDIPKPRGSDLPNEVDLSVMEREASINRAKNALHQLSIQYKTMGKEWKTSGALQKQALQGVSTALTDMTRGIADVIFQGGKMGDVFKRLATEIGKSLVRLVLEQALIPIRKELSKIIGIGTSAATSGIGAAVGSAGSAAGGIAGGVGSSAAGVAVSGAMGMVGVVAGVVSAVSGVIGNFQMAGMNKSLDIIVQNTLRTANQLIYGIQPSLNQWLPGVQGIQDRLVDLANLMSSGGLSFAGGGYGGVNAGSIKIEIGNVYGGPAGLDSLTDEIVRRLQARGLKIG